MLSLSCLIGGLSAFFVALTAAIVLVMSLSVCLSTIEENAIRAVDALGKSGAEQANGFFDTPAQRTLRLAHLPLSSIPSAPSPMSDATVLVDTAAESAAVGVPFGGVTANRFLDLIYSLSAEAKFEYFAVHAKFFDGAHQLLTPIPDSDFVVKVVSMPNETNPVEGEQRKRMTLIDKVTGVAINTSISAITAETLRRYEEHLHISNPLIPHVKQRMQNLVDSLPADGSPVWTKPLFTVKFGGEPSFFSLSQAVITAQEAANTLRLGTVSIAVSFRDIARIVLNGLRLTPNSTSFIFDNNGFLVGACGELPTFEVRNYTEGEDIGPGCSATTESMDFAVSQTLPQIACRYHIARAPYPLLGRLVHGDRPLFDIESLRPGETRLKHEFGSYVFIAPLPATRSSSLLMAVALLVPDEEILGDTAQLTLFVILVSVGVVIAVAAISCVLVWILLFPLKGIAVRMAAAARLQDDVGDGKISALSEIASLQNSFVDMASELNRIRAFVPQSLLRAHSVVMASDSDCGSFSGESATHSAGRESRLHDSSTSYNQSKSTCAGRRDSRMSYFSEVTDATAAPAGRESPSLRAKIFSGVYPANCSILALNLVGFLEHSSLGIDSSKMSCTVDTVMAVSLEQKGVIDYFHGDRFIISYNAVHPAAVHGSRATVTACRLTTQLRSSGFFLQCSAGIGTGSSRVGNTGSSSFQRFSIIGPVLPQACALERLCKPYLGACCLVPERLFSDLQTSVEFVIVDYLKLPHAKKPCFVGAVLSELASCDAGVEDEWMYQIELHQSGRPADQLSQIGNCWRMAARGDMEGATTAFGKLLLENASSLRMSQVEVAATANFRRLTEGASVLHPHDLGIYYNLLSAAPRQARTTTSSICSLQQDPSPPAE